MERQEEKHSEVATADVMSMALKPERILNTIRLKTYPSFLYKLLFWNLKKNKHMFSEIKSTENGQQSVILQNFIFVICNARVVVIQYNYCTSLSVIWCVMEPWKAILTKAKGRSQYCFSVLHNSSYCTKFSAVIVLLHLTYQFFVCVWNDF